MTSSSITAELSLRRIGTALIPVLAAGGVAAATLVNALPVLMAAFGLLTLLAIGLRFPMLILGLFAALVPIEEVLAFGGVGTATRLVGLIFAVAYVMNRRQVPHLSLMPAAGWAFVLWAAVSGLWVESVAAWADAIVTLLQMFVLALLVGDLVSRDPTAARKVMWAYSASAAITVFLLLAAPSESGGFAGMGRAAAFAGQDPAHFSAVLLPAFLFFVYEGARAASSRDTSRFVAILILAGAGLVAWGALLSGTRSAMFGAGVGLVAMASIGTGHRGGRLAIAVVGLVGAGAALLIPGVVDSVLVRLSDAVSTGGAGRLDIWAVGLTIFAQDPIIGVGYAGFPSAFTSDVIRISEIPGLGLSAISVERTPHSILVGTAVELGIVGIVLLGMFLWRVLRSQSTSGLWPFVRAALFAMLAQAMLLDLVNRKQLWLILGVAVGLAAIAKVQGVGGNVRLESDRSLPFQEVAPETAWTRKLRSPVPAAEVTRS